MKPLFLLPAVLALMIGSVEAKDRSAVTGWVCSSPSEGHTIAIDNESGNYLDTLLVASPNYYLPENKVQRGGCIAD